MSVQRPPRGLNLFGAAGRARPVTGARKGLDVLLRKFGVSWQAAPVRRMIQTACLLGYLDLLFRVCWPYAVLGSRGLPDDRAWLPVELFLWMDPLAGLSTAVAARAWNAALIGMAVVLAAGLFFQRGFCGYLCPLGTLIDLFDFVIGKRIAWLKVKAAGCWANTRFYLLAGVLAAALGGVLLSGFVAAIPVLTRGLLLSAGNAQLGLAKNWGMVPPLTAAAGLSLALFAGVFLLSLLGARFWCRCVCPSGALLSLPSLLRRTRRRVDSRCAQCGKCAQACPFDAIEPDFGTRILSCAFCQTCAGVCPAEAISFHPVSMIAPGDKRDVPAGQPLTRRVMLGSVAGGAAAAVLTRLAASTRVPPVRPPGSVPEARFLDLCVRCGQCVKVCPGPVLQLAGWEHGIEGLWTPAARFAHAGCHPECNFCTQVCPTGAIQPLALAAKRRFRIGLAVMDTGSCLPHRGVRECQLCFDECNAAGYRAIEMRPIQLNAGAIPEGVVSPEEIENMSRILAPFVKADACVGCGLCEYRCQSAWASQQQVLKRSAVDVRLV